MTYVLIGLLFGFVIGTIAAEIWDRYKLFRMGVLDVRKHVKNHYAYHDSKIESQTKVYINEGKTVWFHKGRLKELNKPKYEEYRKCAEKL